MLGHGAVTPDTMSDNNHNHQWSQQILTAPVEDFEKNSVYLFLKEHRSLKYKSNS